MLTTLLVAAALGQTPKDALVGVWATTANDAVYVFENATDMRYMEGDKFCLLTLGKFVPNGDYRGNWQRWTVPVEDTSNYHYRLRRDEKPTNGSMAFKLDKIDTRGFPGVLRPEYLLPGAQVPNKRNPVTFVGPLGVVTFQGVYKTDGVELTIDPPTLLMAGKFYSIAFSGGNHASLYTMRIINRETGGTAGLGYMAWAPTPSLVSSIRRSGEIPTDRIFLAVTDGRNNRWTYLGR